MCIYIYTLVHTTCVQSTHRTLRRLLYTMRLFVRIARTNMPIQIPYQSTQISIRLCLLYMYTYKLHTYTFRYIDPTSPPEKAPGSTYCTSQCLRMVFNRYFMAVDTVDTSWLSILHGCRYCRYFMAVDTVDTSWLSISRYVTVFIKTNLYFDSKEKENRNYVQ